MTDDEVEAEFARINKELTNPPAPKWFVYTVGLVIIGVVLALLVPALIAYVKWVL